MNIADLYTQLSDGQKAAAAKIQMAAGEQIEQCSQVDEVAKFVTYVLERVRQQGINKILSMTGQFAEIVTEEEQQKDAVKTTKPD